MPRRNFRIVLIVAVASLLCQRRFNYQGAMFVRAMEEIHAHYLEPVDRSVLLHAALKGMTSRLDPYSEYIPPHDYNDLREDLQQQFGGVGIQINVDPDSKELTVVTPMMGTPAYRAGVLAGDRIVEIDGQNTTGFSIEDAARLLRGQPGTWAMISVIHVGDEKPVKLAMQRAIIEVETVCGDHRLPDDRWDYWLPGHPKIAYIRVLQFSERTVDELQTVLAVLAEQGMQGLVLDLRYNPGGLLDQAIATCDLFVDSGLIVSTRGRGGVPYESFYADGQAPYPRLPLVVLVNHFSASASEIVAACLQDLNRAVIVGERSWGKGSVQNVIPLEGNRSALKLTTLSYWRPSGANIHRLNDAPETEEWGVQPNAGFEVKLDKDQFEKLLKFRRDRDIIRPKASSQADQGETLYQADPQLKRAVEYLTGPQPN